MSILTIGEMRAAQLHDLCRDHNFTELEYSNHSHYRFFIADDSRKSLYCPISKIASTMWKNMLVRSHGKKGRVDLKVHEFDYLQSNGLVYLHKMSVEDAEYRLKNYFRYIIIKHPLDRLVSAWRDGMIHTPEYQKKFGPHIRAFSRCNNTKPCPHEDPSRLIEFSEFLDYIASKNPRLYDRHWLTYYHHCHPCHYKYDFVAKLETFSTDFPILKKKLNFPDDLDLLKLHSYGDDNVSYLSNYDKVSMATSKKLLSIYHKDMILFNYSSPFSF